MSKQIDLSKPLSEADERYLKDRPWLIEDARLSGIELSFSEDSQFQLDDDSKSDSDDGEEEVDYLAFKVDELKAEIAARNEELDEDNQIEPASDKKADLVAALEAHDASQADEATE